MLLPHSSRHHAPVTELVGLLVSVEDNVSRGVVVSEGVPVCVCDGVPVSVIVDVLDGVCVDDCVDVAVRLPVFAGVPLGDVEGVPAAVDEAEGSMSTDALKTTDCAALVLRATS